MNLSTKLQKITKDDIRQERTKRARNSLLNFTLFTDPIYEANWHHRQLMDRLEKMLNGEIKRLMVFMPPRHGKSEIVSRKFPAYALGKDPNTKIIGTSYSSSLASSMNRDVQRIIDSQLYNDVFPETTLSGSNVKTSSHGSYLRNADEFEVVGYRGSYKSAGIGGGITGSGADIAIIDDPIKNRSEAESKTHRDKIFDWFTSTLYTRLEKDAKVLVTLTRWHEEDLAGSLLQKAQEDPEAEQWDVISYPAISDLGDPNRDPTDPRKEGEALWEDKYSAETLKVMKKTIGTYEWSALYEQKPSPSTGGIVQREWFQFYKAAPEKFDQVIQSWDLTFKDAKQSDYVVGQVWGSIGADRYLLDQVRDKLGFTETIRAIQNLSNKWPEAKAKIIEDKANGPAVISSLKKKISGLIPHNPEGSKEARAFAVSPQIESGNVYLPEKATWIHDYVEEWIAFPNGAHDDQIDATTQALIRLDKKKKKSKVKARTF